MNELVENHMKERFHSQESLEINGADIKWGSTYIKVEQTWYVIKV
jgi:hypothetical protein